MIIFITLRIKVHFRLCGDDLAITMPSQVPSQVAKLHSIKKGDHMDISLIGTREFKIKKI